MLRRVISTTAAIGLVLAALAGGAAGVYLGSEVSEQDTRVLSIVDPEFQQLVPEAAIRSTGGFTGFGGLPALGGRVLRFGTVEAVELDDPGEDGAIRGTITIAGNGATTTVRFVRVERLFSIDAAGAGLQVGDLVQLRIEDDRAISVLRLPPDIEAGAGVAGP